MFGFLLGNASCECKSKKKENPVKEEMSIKEEKKPSNKFCIPFIKFKPLILKELNKRKKKFEFKEDLSLFNGFIQPTIQPNLTNNFLIGGPSIPMVLLTGKDSGRVYLFALWELLDRDEVKLKLGLDDIDL